MKELQFFKSSGSFEINVALVGINKMEWEFAWPSQSLESINKRMSDNNFDVLPIVDDGGKLFRYYIKRDWGVFGNNNAVIKGIIKEDCLYYLTHIHDAIEIFSKTNRKYFFLDNQSEILGLITIGNLNCKHVYVYLYNFIIQVEHTLSNYIYYNKINDQKLIDLFEKRTNSENAKNSLKRFNEDRSKGLDYKFIEYLYLADLCHVFKKFNLIEKIEFRKEEFISLIAAINEIRNVIAHPNKSLIKDSTSIHNLSKTLKGIDKLLLKLKL